MDFYFDETEYSFLLEGLWYMDVDVQFLDIYPYSALECYNVGLLYIMIVKFIQNI